MQDIERIRFQDWSIDPGVRGDGAHEVTVRFSVQVDNDPTPSGQEFHRRFGYRIDIKGDPRTGNHGIPRDSDLEQIFAFSRIGFRPHCRIRNGRWECEVVRYDNEVLPFPSSSTVVGSDLDAGSLEYWTRTHTAQVGAVDLNVAEGIEIPLPPIFGGGIYQKEAVDRIYAIVSIVEYSTGRIVRTERSRALRNFFESAAA